MKRPDTRGFMMVELMIALALLGTVLALSYQTLHHALVTWDRTEQKWLAEQEVNRVLGNVEATIRLSYDTQILTQLPENPSGDYSYIYQPSGEDSVWYLATGEGAVAEQVSLLPVELLFDRVERASGGTDYYSNAVRVSVSSALPESGYELDTVVHLPNTQLPVEGAEGRALRLSLSDGSTYQYNTGAGINTRCFVATASYGADTPSVLLLRRLRDQKLLTHAPGRWMVERYYALSPPLAGFIAQSAPLRLAARAALLPFVGLAVLLLHPVFSACVMALAALSAAAAQKYGRRQKNKP